MTGQQGEAPNRRPRQPACRPPSITGSPQRHPKSREQISGRSTEPNSSEASWSSSHTVASRCHSPSAIIALASAKSIPLAEAALHALTAGFGDKESTQMS